MIGIFGMFGGLGIYQIRFPHRSWRHKRMGMRTYEPTQKDLRRESKFGLLWLFIGFFVVGAQFTSSPRVLTVSLLFTGLIWVLTKNKREEMISSYPVESYRPKMDFKTWLLAIIVAILWFIFTTFLIG